MSDFEANDTILSGFISILDKMYVTLKMQHQNLNKINNYKFKTLPVRLQKKNRIYPFYKNTNTLKLFSIAQETITNIGPTRITLKIN